MEDLIKNIALKYYKESSIASISFANSRAIITIQNEPENNGLAQKLKDELSSFENICKISGHLFECNSKNDR